MFYSCPSSYQIGPFSLATPQLDEAMVQSENPLKLMTLYLPRCHLSGLAYWIGSKIGESTKVIVTPPQIFVWVDRVESNNHKFFPKNSSNRFQIGLKGLVLWTPL